ncbi:MAG: Planctomycete cytochrome, partial [Bryobacterales bacterium]|nr:Planctomycete cytochrome [Bryobacterales bacterium]
MRSLLKLPALRFTGLLVLPASMVLAQTAAVSFSKDIGPLMAGKCVQCHGGASRMGDLDLRSSEGLLKGGKHGPAVVAGKADESLLFRHITGQVQPQMPLGTRLPDAQIAQFRAWIDAGAKWDGAPTLTSVADTATPTFTAMQKRYWFFQPVAKPVVPKVNAKNPVDAFIVAKLEEKKIQLNGRADKVTLLRRATLDLTGLPPTPEETQAFVADESPEAFAKVVDRLLASPHYGERWGRMWLDVVRYADTNGFKADEFRPNIWRYRDYVVKAFNEDKPYDRFIKEQIAGDEMYPGSLDARIATGFMRHYTDETNQPSMELRRSELLNNVTDTTAAAFMGLTFGCAKCHDHKFDPILQKDYYRLQAFFSNIRPNDETVLLQGEALAKYNAQMAEWEAKASPIRAQMHAMVEPFAKTERDYYMPRFSAGTQEAIKTPEEQRTPFQKLLAFHGMPQISHTDESFAKKLKPEEKKKFDELAAELKKLDPLKPKAPMAQTIVENGPEAPPTFVLAGGSWMAPKE